MTQLKIRQKSVYSSQRYKNAQRRYKNAQQEHKTILNREWQLNL
jgi:hypothetical protein